MTAGSAARTGSGGVAGLGAAERRLLPIMPLHAITSVYGEAGLRERLLLEAAVFTPADRAQVERALVLAAELHGQDRRQREPYLNHLLRVAVRIISHYRVAVDRTWPARPCCTMPWKTTRSTSQPAALARLPLR